MTVLFAGGENSEVDILNGSTITTTIHFRSTYARCAVRSLGDNGVLHTYTGALASYIAGQGTAVDFWYGYRYVGVGGTTTGHHCVKFCGAGFVPFLRIYNGIGLGNGQLQISTDGFSGNPANTTDFTASNIAQPSTPIEWTFRIKRHATQGLFQWWIAGALWYQFSGDTTPYFTTVTRTSFGEGGTTVGNGISEIIATSADDPRVGMNLFTAYYTGNGTNTGWTGTYTDVNENSEDTATVEVAATAGLDSCFTHPAIPALSSGVVIRAIIDSGKWRRAIGAGPQNLSGYLRIGSTNYPNAPVPAAIQAVASVAGLLQFIWHLSPATGLAFTETETNNLQPGMESVT